MTDYVPILNLRSRAPRTRIGLWFATLCSVAALGLVAFFAFKTGTVVLGVAMVVGTVVVLACHVFVLKVRFGSTYRGGETAR